MAPRAACLLSLLLIASARVILVDAICVPVETSYCGDDPAILCRDCEGMDKVPNPLDCSTYYMCKGPGVFLFDDPLPCPDGQIFNMIDSECSPDAECQFSCGSTNEGGCFYTCDNDKDGMIADPFDCSVYHQCTGTSGTDPGPAQTCPADEPYFDGKECVADESACCHCRPYCYEGDIGKKVEDPTDCRKFFFCLENHVMPTIPGECRDGEHFDMHAGECSSTAPCMTLCRNVVDENGCIDPYTCQETGFFPKCKTQCLREYYHCVEVTDDYAPTETCSDDLVFNPDTLQCTRSESCPYSHQYVPLDPVPA
ncbi:peritrophin-48-like [Portunus trituberculatus]|uniref:peritrophin-48-like n=1 Tax=Portunus trituberculatus TaxID=210409 RepID=UPI001E1D01E0|nr:peritrophin-48-like [Portunus trituberculatus]